MAAINSTPTPSSIEEHYINAFKDGLEAVFQKTESILEPYVNTVTQLAEEQYYDRIGAAGAMVQDTTRFGENPHQDIAFDRRRSVLEYWETGQMIDEKDLTKIASDPTNAYTQAMAAAAKRQRDDMIMNAAYESVWTGKKGTTEVKWAAAGSTDMEGKIKVGGLSVGVRAPITTAGRYVVETGDYEGVVVDHRYTGSTASSTGITLAKLQAYRSALIRLEVLNQMDFVTLFVGEQQLEELLNITEIKNGDYNVRKALAEGGVTTFMGYRFIPYTGLPTVTVGSTSVTRCLALPTPGTKMGQRHGLWCAQAKALDSNMWRLPARKNIPYIYMSMASKPFRMWGELVGEIRCA